MNRITNNSMLFPGATLTLWICSTLLLTAQAATRHLETAETTALKAGLAKITLILDAPAPAPDTFTLSQPNQLIIDLPDTVLGAQQRYHRVDAAPVTGLTLAETDGRTRVVAALARSVRHKVRRDGDRIHILVTADIDAAGSIPAQAMTGARVTDTDFRRGEDDSGRIKLTLANLGQQARIERRDSRVIAVLPQTSLPQDLERRLDVLDFATPVQYVDISSRNDDTVVTVTPVSDAQYRHAAYQSDDELILELTPITPAEQEQAEAEVEEKEEPQFTGEEISLSFQKIDIRSVLQIIAEIADVNMVVADSIDGDITLQLDNVPWDQALNIILRTQGLGIRRIGNVMSVASLNEIASLERAQREADEAMRQRKPLRSEIIQINYANADEIAGLLRKGGKETALISERGQVSVDARTNSLLIYETQDRLQDIRRVINKLDIPIRQVQVEARIVVASRDFSRELGLNTGFSNPRDPGISGYIDNAGYTINIPTIGNATGQLTSTIISNTMSLDLALTAMESEKRGEIISSPHVITTDGQEAVIEQGQQVPYVTPGAANTPATTDFKDVVLNLTVTPHITPDEHVLMDMKLTQDNVNSFLQNGEPLIDTRSVKTQVLVDDGNTVVLGGIFQHEQRDTGTKIPLLGDIPLIGALFSSRIRDQKKLELLLFITPRILQESLYDSRPDNRTAMVGNAGKSIDIRRID